jgi:hypothetical protein
LINDEISEIDEPLSVNEDSDINSFQSIMRPSSIADSQIIKPAQSLISEAASLDINNFYNFGEGPCSNFYEKIGEKFEENHIARKKRTIPI